MITGLIRVTVLVRDQDEALRFYTETLGLEKRADVSFGPGMRWLTVAPRGQSGLEIVLQKPEPAMHGAENAQQMQEMVGRGTTWVFACDDCRATFAELRGRGVEFASTPREEPYGIEAVFTDLYGNSFSLLQPAPRPSSEPETTHAKPPISKDEIISMLQGGHVELQAALAGVDAARLTRSGATGDWSAKDVLAHIASGYEWQASEIARKTRGEAGPGAAELQKMHDEGLFDNETRNRLDYEHYKDMPLEDVLAWWRRAYDHIIAAVEAAPESVLFGPDWWTGGRPIAEVMDAPHEGEHAQAVRDWAQKQV